MIFLHKVIRFFRKTNAIYMGDLLTSFSVVVVSSPIRPINSRMYVKSLWGKAKRTLCYQIVAVLFNRLPMYEKEK